MWLRRCSKFALRLVPLWLLAVAAGLAALVGVCALPGGDIPAHIKDSAPMLVEETKAIADYKVLLWAEDPATDAVMLAQCWLPQFMDPVRGALYCPMFPCEEGVVWRQDALVAASAHENPLSAGFATEGYVRYWNGYRIVLRPLLMLTDCSGVRAIYTAATLLLLLLTAVAARRRLGDTTAAVLVAVVLISFLPAGGRSLMYPISYCIGLGSAMLLLRVPALTRTAERTGIAFFVIGMATSYFELLCTPLIALCIPLTLLPRLRTVRRPAFFALALIVLWGLGYVMMWGAKWLIAWAYFGSNFDIFADVFHTVGRWLGKEWDTKSIWCILADRPLKLLLLACVSVLWCVWLWRHRAAVRNCRRDTWLLLAAAAPIVWFFSVHVHSGLHLWFTWRTLAITLLPLTLYTLAVKRCADKIKQQICLTKEP